jgi:hypothetical protein
MKWQMARDAVKEALAQPEPPPEWMTEEEQTAYTFGWFKALEAQRTWVGLTDEETLSIFATCHEGRVYPQDFYSGPRAMRLAEGRAIEAKLKEKNT